MGFSTGMYDGEPDLFTYNFAGYTGKFFFNDDRLPVLVSGEDIKIDYYFPADTAQQITVPGSNIQGFIITVPNGNKYYFGINSTGVASGAAPVEMTYPFSEYNGNLSDRIYTSWYLNKIESADAKFSINLSYTQERYSYYSIGMFPQNGIPDYSPGPQNLTGHYLVKNFIDGVRLNQITTSNGTVTFNATSTRTDLSNGWATAGFNYNEYPNTEAKALGDISISNNNGYCKKFQLYTSYFSDPSNYLPERLNNYSVTTDKQRLRLDSIKEQSCDGSIIVSPYRFTYFSDFLPRRLSFAQDHWGFYNGASNATLIPTYSVDTFDITTGANRDASWPEMANGSLSKISYPTGGSDTFAFEANSTYISTTRYVLTYAYGVSVGYDSHNSSDFPDKYFSGNHYQVTISNAACPAGTPECGASITFLNSSGQSVASLSAPGDQTITSQLIIPAGNYTLHLYRQNVQSGTGASITISEIKPTPIEGNFTVGGLRIAKITRNDGISTNSDTSTVFDYNVNGRSSGILYSRPAYVQVVRNDQIALQGWHGYPKSQFIHGCVNPEGISKMTYYKSPCPVMPMTESQGNHIGYNEVKVSKTGRGYSIFRYYGSNAWDYNVNDVAIKNVNQWNCDFSIPNTPAAPVPYEYQRGELKYQGYFNESGKIVKDIYYAYYFDSTKLTTPAYKVESVLGNMLLTRYELRGYRKTQTQTTETSYYLDGSSYSTTQIENYGSKFHQFPTETISISPTLDSFRTAYKYSFDFRVPACDAIDNGLTSYEAACKSCDSLLAVKAASAPDDDTRWMYSEDNIVCKANARVAFITYRKANFTNPTNNFKTAHISAENNANVDLKPILELQDEFKIVPIETSTWKNGSLLSASLNKYGISNNPAGFAYPVKTQMLKLGQPSPTFTTADLSDNGLISDSRYDLESNILFAGGNLAEVTLRNNTTSSYVWDYNNTYPIAKILNATSGQVAYTSFEADGTGNWTIPSTARTADGITGKKCYQLSSGAITKNALISANKYIISYWTKNASSFSIAGTQGSAIKGRSVNGWTNYEHIITGVTSVSISGTGLIDELRFFPTSAQMTTFTYEPLVGMTAQADMDNRIMYYEYDALLRLTVVKDQDGNIVKTIEYNFKK